MRKDYTKMNSWQITKYNPIYKDNKGIYCRDEWTEFCDIGNTFNGVLLEKEEYFRVENLYVKAIIAFIEGLNLTRVQVTDLENKLYQEENPYYNDASSEKVIINEDIKDYCEQYFKECLKKYSKYYTKGMIDLFYNIKVGQWVNIEQVKDIIRLILRNHFWCTLSLIPKIHIDFLGSFYINVNSDLKCDGIIEEIVRSGLFVEKL